MRRGDRRKAAPEETPAGTRLPVWVPALLAVAIMVTGCMTTLAVLQLDAFRPGLGDIVAFEPTTAGTDLWQLAIEANRVSPAGSPAVECALDPNVMAEKGGSLIVEGRQDKPTLLYRVHWAGSATARLRGDCGDSADLLVSRTDLQRLANAAGGFGTGVKGFAD